MEINLKGNPFYLSDEDINWVETTFASMSLEEKIGQLFCPIAYSSDENQLKDLVEAKHIGGVLYREGAGKDILKNHGILQRHSKIPLLIASNLEMGGTGSVSEGTFFGKQLEVAATGNTERAYQLGKVACTEGALVGVNWSFAPVVDIDYNFRNPITNIRTFGSDPKRILEMAKQYCKGAFEAMVAPTIKHFPGDGVDERDQHLVTSVNSLSCEEWDATYGKIYQGLIEDGVPTIMAGHIAMPAYEKALGNYEGEVIPATLSSTLLHKLLRDKLKFNGLIVTDATPMVGFCAAMERERAVPLSIENGCDMFLFNKSLEEDYQYMIEGYQNKILSSKRLNDANIRILATKAFLKLHKKQQEGKLMPKEAELSGIHSQQFQNWASECADEAITLVKDTQDLLPITPAKHKRVLVEILGDFPSNDRIYEQFERLLLEEGFEPIKYIPEDFTKPLDTSKTLKKKYDLVMYIGNIDNASNKTVARINWHTMFGSGNNMPWFVKELPTMFISVGNPYHLIDVPMVKTFINGYCNTPYVIKAIVEKIVGRSTFKGISPIDPFCGLNDTKY